MRWVHALGSCRKGLSGPQYSASRTVPAEPCQPNRVSRTVSTEPCQPNRVSRTVSAERASRTASAERCQPNRVSRTVSAEPCQPSRVNHGMRSHAREIRIRARPHAFGTPFATRSLAARPPNASGHARIRISRVSAADSTELPQRFRRASAELSPSSTQPLFSAIARGAGQRGHARGHQRRRQPQACIRRAAPLGAEKADASSAVGLGFAAMARPLRSAPRLGQGTHGRSPGRLQCWRRLSRPRSYSV